MMHEVLVNTDGSLGRRYSRGACEPDETSGGPQAPPRTMVVDKSSPKVVTPQA